MEIVVNGERRPAPSGQSLLAFVRALGFAPEHLAVELNGRVVEDIELKAVVLAPEDRLEIVRFVGGG